MLRIREMLEFPCLKGSIVLAGQQGLDNPVRCIDVIEVPDADQWVTPGTFFLTTAYAYRENISRLAQLIKLQAEGGASGIGIKVGRFIQALPEEVLKISEQEAFPMILLPPELPYVPVIKEVMSQIFEREQFLKRSLNKQEILQYMLRESVSEKEKLDFFRQLNLSLSDQCCFILFEFPDNRGVNDISIWEFVEKTRLKRKNFFAVQLDNIIGLLFIVCDESSFVDVKNIARRVSASSQSELGAYYVSVSALHFLEEGIKEAYKEACFSLKIIKKLMIWQSSFADFDSLHYLYFWYTHPNRKDLIHTSRLILEPVLAYDENNNSSLLQTLKIFLLMDCNQKKAAEELHLHRNSLRYRLNQIEGILGTDVFSGFKLQRLLFALITYALLEDENPT